MTNSKEDESIRPWGHYEILLDEVYCKVKRIFVKPGQRLSYQYHHKRQEAWTVVSGIAKITIDGKTKNYQPGETVLIPLWFGALTVEKTQYILKRELGFTIARGGAQGKMYWSIT